MSPRASHRVPAIVLSALVGGVLLGAAPGAASAATFYNFESPQTHPIALSPGGTFLYAVNTADNRLSVFDRATMVRIAEVQVGMEPVGVAHRPFSNEVWVVNHLSDTVDVIDTNTWRVARTIVVGDEPAALAFNPAGSRAYVTLSQRNQLVVIDAASRIPNPPINLLPPLSNSPDPRAIDVDRTGAFAYVATFESGNRTRGLRPSTDPNALETIIFDPTLNDDDLIVVRLLDNVIVNRVPNLGAVLTNVRVSPDNARVCLTGWDARNLVFMIENLGGHPTVNKLVCLDRATLGVVVNVDLDGPQPYERSQAVAQPSDLVFDARGRIWVTAQGNDEVVILDAAGRRIGRLPSGRGPRGLAFDPGSERLYVFNRLSRDITVIDTAADAVRSTVPIGYAPDPTFVEGRRFFYTAGQSGDGTQACVSCHADGHHDNLVWDVGEQADPKGPMVTQTLRGIFGDEPNHWRGEKPDLTTFNLAFEKLFNGTQLPAEDNQKMADYMGKVELLPNPNSNRDGTLTSIQAHCGQQLFMGVQPVDCGPGQHFNFPCVACHALPDGSNHLIIPGSVLLEHADFEVPVTQGMYDRVGFAHAGVPRTLVEFLSASPPFPPFSQADKQAMEAFVLQFPTDHHAAVGIERTANQGVCPGGVLDPEIAGTISFLEVEAGVGVLDLVVAGTMAPYGDVHFLFDPNTGTYFLDRSGPAPVTSADLTAAACAGTASLSFTGWAVGMGDPRARDSDEDGVMSGDEPALGTDARNPDTDADALKDGAEAGFGTSPTDPDTDDDGSLDGEEVADGTNPTNPNSVLKFLSVETVGGGADVQLDWTTVFNRRYLLQNFDGSGLLTGTEVFSDLHTTPSPEDESPEGTESFVDMAAAPPPGSYRIYKVKALPPGS